MRTLQRLTCALVPALALAACGGGDASDRLNLTDPAVRFVHASPGFGALTLYRDSDPAPDATGVDYKFASDYFDVRMESARWSIKSADGRTTYGSVDIDPSRGEKYTLVAVQHAGPTLDATLIRDPFNQPIGSSTARLRLMQAAFNTDRVDVYMNAPGTDIALPGVNPLIAATAFNAAGPASGEDSVAIPGGEYQLTITQAGTKTVIFRGLTSFEDNRDVLLVTVPAPSMLRDCIRTLVKVDKVEGATEIAATDVPYRACLEPL